ncbi:MAG: asparagine synthase (glutamine-hydrolyzing), partial [Vicinamibacteria bacterium]
GVFRARGLLSEAERSALTRMLDAEKHRGPDGVGAHEDGPALLGHRRLAIIDLSESARQPMPNETEDVWLTFNGEIYNFVELRDELRALGHRFRSRTDAEVVIHGYEAWGMEKLLSRLRGMFAFALWDRRARKLVLARDRFGIKPLYCAWKGDTLLFASEVGALAASRLVDLEPSDKALSAFLALGSIPSPETALKAVSSIPAAHYVEVSNEGERSKRYWEPFGGDGREEAVPALLREAVEMHLVSDVPLGVFLSGGIDSASLVAIASRFVDEPLKTLSVVFDDPALDESAYARKVAEKYRTDHREVRVGAGEFLDALPEFWRAMDQPTVDGVNAFLVSRAARQAGLKVVLTGLGGDEVFLGYPHFRKIRTLSRWVSFVPHGPLCRFLPRAEYLRHPTPSNVYLMFRGLFAPREIEELLPGAAAPTLAARSEDFLDAAVELEFSHYLGNQLLRDTDVMSMAHAIEARVPFLDHLLADAVARVPYEKKMKRGINKPLLLSSLEEPLPREVWDRPKQGFTLPFHRWMKEHGHELTERTLAARLFEPEPVRRLWRGFSAGRVHWSRPWSLVAYSAWRERLRSAARIPEPEELATTPA